MLRTLLLGSLLLVAFVPTGSAAQPLPDILKCDGNGVCVFVHDSEWGTCAGVGIGLQGFAGCARPADQCVGVHWGFNTDWVCVPGQVSLGAAGPDPCGAVGCGAPILVVNEDGACAGYGSRYGGTAGCLDYDEGVCVITAGEFWYKRECTGATLP